jgi:hypothetical protein
VGSTEAEEARVSCSVFSENFTSGSHVADGSPESFKQQIQVL